ncbi:unnamed protein product [Acanthoscelides obtectus]|uniref:Endonuclease/exonuclease/phosphatase domain-containing protein n=1 Tax=Acanthoscelides obtectus TaxID=200917 RepID=A0A9P0Q6J8_ACAOB|nr:unnamed protein product [Acanthoscelides obtectus]CAK1643577.1 hypothetical protein AOBTE_LOCUS13587 [Acanthoscelides obtectus]
MIKVLHLITHKNSKKIAVTALYRPPSTNANAFVEDLEVFLKKSSKHVDMHFLTGDININILEHSETSQNYLNLLSEHNFISTINNFTRVDLTSKTCIDHMFVKGKTINFCQLIPIIYQNSISDHFSIILKVILDEKPSSSTPTYIQKIEESKLVAYVLNEDWSAVYGSSNVNEATDKFASTIQSHIEKSTIKIKLTDRKRKCWITNGLLRSINHKNELFQQMLNNPNEQTIKKFKDYRNKLGDLIKQRKADYYNNFIVTNSNNSKSLWKCVKDVSCVSTRDKNIERIITKNQVEVNDKKIIAQEFANYFNNVGKRLAENIAPTTSFVSNKKLKNSIFLEETNEEEVLLTILDLKDTVASSLESIYGNYYDKNP